MSKKSVQGTPKTTGKVNKSQSVWTNSWNTKNTDHAPSTSIFIAQSRDIIIKAKLFLEATPQTMANNQEYEETRNEYREFNNLIRKCLTITHKMAKRATWCLVMLKQIIEGRISFTQLDKTNQDLNWVEDSIMENLMGLHSIYEKI